jgi:hypothetical protein
MDPEEKQEQKNKCLTRNVTTTKRGTDGKNQSNVKKKVRPPPKIVGKIQNYQERYNHLKKTTTLISKQFY